ncbi:MAG TPA: cytidine deaminase [Elusimicrobiota bacterium]|jgi:cytidine deaminase|nr:cytidine deaminase [Elusimicrobiota bacterium]
MPRKSADISPALRNKLIAAAKRVRFNAFAPYSRYYVGSAVLGGSGRIHAGVNVESPSLISHVCAERNAIFSAITQGEREILAVATVCTSSVSCGSCRQMIREFARGDIPIFAVYHDVERGTERMVRTTIGRLLPESHTGDKFDWKKRTQQDAADPKPPRRRAK